MLNSKTRIILTIVLLIMVSFYQVTAQTRISSPYSKFGLGELEDYNNPRYAAMGGMGIALNNPYSVNVLNPASYAAFDSLSFVFEGGVISNFSTIKNNTLSQKSNYTSLSYITFGFPITKWWRASFGLLPYSNVGFKVSDKESIANVGNVTYRYEGSGGINQLYLGNAIKFNKNLSIGFNASYLFGALVKTNSILFPDSALMYNSKTVNTVNIGNFCFKLGLQYNKKLTKDYTLFTGAVLGTTTNATTNEDFLTYTYSLTAAGNEVVHDTNENVTNVKGTVRFPMSYGFGIALERNEKWLLGVDYSVQNWSDYTYDGYQDSLKNSMKISIGLELKPNPMARYFYQRVAYRLGYKYAKNYLQIDNNKLTEYGVSFGIGLPLRKTKSTINLAVEIGKRGTTSITDPRLLQENYVKFTLGFSAHDVWFFKRKFD